MEFLSDEDGGELSVRSTPPYGKLYFYEQILKVPVYVTYDPYATRLEVRFWQDGQYQSQQADVQGRFWIPALQLFLGLWSGERLNFNIPWLRWWNQSGNLLLWSSEQTEQERQRAGQECQRVEQMHQRAEQANQRAEEAHQRAEQERQRAEQADQRAATLAAKLRELGVDPEQLNP
jgi:hypothetical protein